MIEKLLDTPYVSDWSVIFRGSPSTETYSFYSMQFFIQAVLIEKVYSFRNPRGKSINGKEDVQAFIEENIEQIEIDILKLIYLKRYKGRFDKTALSPNISAKKMSELIDFPEYLENRDLCQLVALLF